jgi:predicted O-methyltransferase YrrM
MDLIVGGLMINGNDAFRSGKKLGRGYRSVGDLEFCEVWEYIKPFVRNLYRYDCKGVIIHDGLPDDFITEYSNDQLKFEFVNGIPKHHANYERRHFAFKIWLEQHKEIKRLWLIDANDIGFTKHPFEWMDENQNKLAIGEEWTAYGKNQWFIDALKYLPPEYKKLMLDDNPERFPVNCGAWGGLREDVMTALRDFCNHIEKLKAYLDDNPAPHALVLDMHAFAAALLQRKDLKLFKMDGRTVHNGVASPLIHDRKPALELDEKENNPLTSVYGKLKLINYLPGWCQENKATEMLNFTIRQRPKVCVEIGVYGGRSLIAQALGLQHLKRGVIYGIDPWKIDSVKEGGQFGVDVKHWNQEQLNTVYEQFVVALTALNLHQHTRIVCGESQNVSDIFEDESVDVLHIDGNHAELPALRDVTVYLPKVKSGGWVWFDDTDWDTTQPALKMLVNSCNLVSDWGNFRLYRKK